jgi:hypothetical protein
MSDPPAETDSGAGSPLDDWKECRTTIGRLNVNGHDVLLVGGRLRSMSEAELHVLRARLIGGQLAKASRGELEMKLPVGLVYDAAGRVVLDPDLQVQEALRTFFETFRRTGSATGTVRSFRERGLLFPRRWSSGPHCGELAWGPLLHHRALRLLKNPRYAGAFAFGRSRVRRTALGTEHRTKVPREQWHTLILDTHPGYVTWSEYGATHTLRLPRPRPAVQLHKVDPAVVVEIDRLLDAHTDREIADILNSRGLQPGVADKFSSWMIWRLRTRHGLEDRCSRLRRQGLLTLEEMAAALGVHPATVQQRQARGHLVSVVYNDKGQRLYAPPGEPVMVACSRCGKPTPERNPRGVLQKYCSVTCRTGAYASRRRAAGWVRIRRRP